jgi:hypothetical protein
MKNVLFEQQKDKIMKYTEFCGKQRLCSMS